MKFTKKLKPETPTNAFVVNATVDIKQKTEKFRPTVFNQDRYFHQAKNRFQGQQQPFRGKLNNDSRQRGALSILWQAGQM